MPEQIAFVRLENTEDNHYKFYEMTIQREDGRCNVIIRYGRIGAKGKTIFLRGKKLPNGEAKNVVTDVARKAFLKQLTSKFKDKQYTLIDLQVNDQDLEDDISRLQDQYEDLANIMGRLEFRGF